MTLSQCADAFEEKMSRELKTSGDFTGPAPRNASLRHYFETLVGLDEYYAVEEGTVDERKSGER
jgi:hypothetical protein